MVNTHWADGGFSRWAPVCFQATVMDKFVSDKTPADAGGPWGNLCGFVLLVSWPTLMSLIWSAGHVVVMPATSYVKVYKWLICLGENFQSGRSYFGSQKLILYNRSGWWIHLNKLRSCPYPSCSSLPIFDGGLWVLGQSPWTSASMGSQFVPSGLCPGPKWDVCLSHKG